MGNICIKDQDKLNKKISKLKRGGIDSLHVVSDFDRTLTGYYRNGEKIQSLISLIRSGNYLAKDYSEKAYSLFDKYNPIELDESLPLNFKKQKMKEWWEEHRKLFIKSKMNGMIISNIVQEYPDVFRKGALKFFDMLHKYNVPLLIFSSGIGDLIESHLVKEDRLYNNMHIISNFFDYNQEGYVIGYKEKIIHTLNKSEIDITNERYLNLLSKRENIILLGDSISDLGMIANIDHKMVLSIGFLNDYIDEDLEKYKQAFDVVLVNDAPMDYVNNLLKEIVKG